MNIEEVNESNLSAEEAEEFGQQSKSLVSENVRLNI